MTDAAPATSSANGRSRCSTRPSSRARGRSQVVDALPVPPDPYVRTLIEHAVATRDEADRRIAGASVGWPLDRMAVVDRIVLRLAVAELLDPDGPPRPS